MTAQNARLRRCGAALLCLVCAAVMVRSAFVGLEIDEEYALSLGFRLVSGDRLFYSMWEPHQLSSLPSAALLAAFMAVTGGTTGVLLFFRLVVLVCKAAMSYAFYREFRRDLGGRGALLAALCGEATRRDYDVTACPSPEEPGRLEHLLIPELGVAFVTSKPGMVYPGKPYRRVRLDALSHPENKARLRFRARMTGVLREEAIAALQEAKAAHDLLEGVYNPYVDFEGVRAQAALEAGRLLSWMK